MTGNRDHLEIAYRSVAAFADDGKLDEHELDKLLSIAIKDGVVDEDETRVLSNIISRLKSYELTPQMTSKVKEVEKKYSISIL